MDVCLFCRIVNREEPSHIIWEDENFLAFLDIHPDHEGHTLFIPKKHISSIYALDEPFYSEFFQVAQQLFEPLKRAMKVEGVAIRLHTVDFPHIRLHLIPSNRDDLLHRQRGIEVTSGQLAEVARRIRDEISLSHRAGAI